MPEQTPTFGEDGYFVENLNGDKIYDGQTGVVKGSTTAPTVVAKLFQQPDQHGIVHANRNDDGTVPAMEPAREGTHPGQQTFEITVGGRTYFSGRVPLPAHIQLAANVWVFAESWVWRDAA